MKRFLMRLYIRVRFGKLEFITKDTIAGNVCEMEVNGRSGMHIGYWAYGSYDPSYPYRGQDE